MKHESHRRTREAAAGLTPLFDVGTDDAEHELADVYQREEHT